MITWMHLFGSDGFILTVLLIAFPIVVGIGEAIRNRKRKA